MDDLIDFLRRNFDRLKYLLLISIIGFVGYLFYLQAARNKVIKTQSDISYINTSIHNGYPDSKYKNFDTDTIVFSNFLPPDMERKQNMGLFEVFSRFGGHIKVSEAFGTKDERTLYLSLYNNQQSYKSIYQGVSAYIISLMELNKSECVMLAKIDWRNVSKTFMGMEIAQMVPSKPYNGIYNLNHYLLFDNIGEEFSTRDDGVISRKALTVEEAERACTCRWKDCIVSLKFF